MHCTTEVSHEEIAAAMEGELREIGFSPLKTAKEVANHMANQKGVTLLFVNAMCGCAGVGARVGTMMALQNSSHQPDHLITVFAGVDDEATAEVFTYTKPYPPSSPAIALFKDGAMVFFLERHQIKGVAPEEIAQDVQGALEGCFA
jgi:putative YphP/YqiW family bacilliredoxin